MKLILNIFFAITLVILFSQCSSAQKLQETTPFLVDQIYSQKWIAGVQGGGSGINLFLKLADTNHNVVLDSAYFRGKAVKFESNSVDNYYIGRFSTSFNKKQDVILSDEPNGEFGNEAPIIPKKIPFNLNDNESVISYKENNKTKYFKIEKITEKRIVSYPSAPPNKQ